MSNKKVSFNMDERNKLLAYKVITIMYFLTIFAIHGIVLYRQFVLHQEIREFEDLAIIMTVNSIFLIAALLYFGAVPIQKISIRNLILIYLGFVVLGSIFTTIKYNVFQKLGLTVMQLGEKILIVAAIIGILIVFWILMSWLGNRKIEKEILDEE